jgi:hypothetical protein
MYMQINTSSLIQFRLRRKLRNETDRTRYGEPSSTGCAETSSWILLTNIISIGHIENVNGNTYSPLRLLSKISLVCGLRLKLFWNSCVLF